MTARALRDGIADLLVNDATFAAAVATLVGQSVTHIITANTPIEQIPSGQWPCWIVEQGDGNAQSISNDGDDFLTIGNSEQHFASVIDVFLLWHQADREAAADVRSDLSTLFAQLMLRNPCPGGVLSAWLSGWKTDAGVKHPNHIFAAEITGNYAIPRS